MITAQPSPSLDDLVTQLTQQAAALAEANARSAQLASRQDPVRWREASLVWPLFTSSLMKKKG